MLYVVRYLTGPTTSGKSRTTYTFMSEGPEILAIADDISITITQSTLISLGLISGPYVLSIDKKFAETRSSVDYLNKVITTGAQITKVSADGRYLMFEVEIKKPKKKPAYTYIAVAGFSKAAIESVVVGNKTPAMTLQTSAGSLNIYAGANIRIVVASGEEIDELIGENGYNVFDKEADENILESNLSQDNRPIAKVLIDPNVIVGVGTVYRSEILFYAKINPLAITSELIPGEIEKLIAAIKYVMYTAYTRRPYVCAVYDREETAAGEKIFQYMYGGRLIFTTFEPVAH